MLEEFTPSSVLLRSSFNFLKKAATSIRKWLYKIGFWRKKRNSHIKESESKKKRKSGN